jgi:hypothetical protein
LSSRAGRAELRASDADRDEFANELALQCAAGRLSLDEFEVRVAHAQAARTLGELDALVRDLGPSGAGHHDRGSPAGIPGTRPFSTRVELPARAETVHAEALEKVAPELHRYGYELRTQTPGALVFERRVRPMWVPVVAILAFPVGLLALAVKETQRIVISLDPKGSTTTVVTVHGNAPRGIRKAFAELALS